MHIYEKHSEPVKQYILEGHQRPDEMPEMPNGNPFDVVPMVLKAETRIRNGESFRAEDVIDDPYWTDIVRLLQVHWARRRREDLSGLRSAFVNPVYLPFVNELPPTNKRDAAT